MALAKGDVLAGKYRVEKLLGEGGMGAVYVATNTVLQRKIALKVMSGSFAQVPAAIERFHREAIAASKVSHPSIVQVFDAGQHEGAPWIAMELLEGESLADRLERGPLSVAEVILMARGALSALAEVHEQGIVHRDLKPDNIFLAKDRGGGFVPKVLDFGIAKDTSDNELNKLTATGAVVGTAHYLSPEQARGTADIDARADVYAMGVVLFESLSGKMPYEAETITQLIAMMFTEPPRALAAVAPEVPGPLADVVSTCLQQNRDHRYGSAGELLAGFEHALSAMGAQGLGAMPTEPPSPMAHTMPGGPHAGSAPAGAPSSGAPAGAKYTGPMSAPSPALATSSGQPQLPQTAAAYSGSPGSHAGVSQPGVSQPGASQPGAVHPGASYPGAVHPGASYPGAPVAGPIPSAAGYAAPREEPGGGRLPLLVLMVVLFFVGALGTGGVAWWLLRSDRGEPVAQDVPTAPVTPSATVMPAPAPEPEPAPEPQPEPENAEIVQAVLDPPAPPRRRPAGRSGSTAASGPRGEPPAETSAERSSESPASGREPAPRPQEIVRRQDPPPRQSAPPRPPPPRVGISPQQIAAAVNERRPYADRRCFERRRRRVRDLGGIVTIGWVVRPDGRADNVEVVHNGTGDEWFGRCIRNVVRGTRFPQARNGLDTRARYPFRF